MNLQPIHRAAQEGDAEALRNNAENDRTTRSVRRLHVNAVKCLLRRVALSVYTFSPQDLPRQRPFYEKWQ